MKNATKHKKLLITLCSIALIALGCAKEPSLASDNPQEELNRCARLSQKKKHEEAIQCLESLKSRYPRSSAGQEAELRIGDVYYRQKQYLLAAESYTSFLQLYPHSPRVDYAHYRAGLSYLRESPAAIDRDQQYLTQALEHLNVAASRYPQSAYRSLAAQFLHETRNRFARRHFYIGRFYYRTGEYIAAIHRLKEVSTNFADNSLAPKALYFMTMANLKLGDVESAKGVFSLLATQYPKNEWTAKTQGKLLKATEKNKRKES